MHNNINQLISIQKEIQTKIIELNYKDYNPKIIAVSKTFSMSEILPLINHGHKDFGENKVQEAVEKWSKIKNDKIKLHLVGKLQTNKVKFALKIFDFIHSLDNLKLSGIIFGEAKRYAIFSFPDGTTVRYGEDTIIRSDLMLLDIFIDRVYIKLGEQEYSVDMKNNIIKVEGWNYF